MLIDFHAHVFLDKLAPRAVQSLAERAHIVPHTDGTLRDTQRVMREGGVDRFVCLNIAVAPRTEAHVNDFAISLLSVPEAIPFGSVHPDSPHALDELRRLHEAGVRGVKFHNEYQDFYVDDKRAFPLYERCADSIVAITGTVEDESGYYWGTGIIASPDGLIVTNAHIIDGCDSAKVTLYNDESFEAKLVGVDAISDLALLKIDAEELPAATFGDISSIAVGDQVAAIGNPLGEDFRSTLTNGIISAIDRGLNYNGRTMSLLQTNTAINQGNSGGALFNMYGQVVGITNMKMMSYYSSIEGIGFAIPSSTVKSVVDSLAANGEVRGRPSIGITVGAIPEDVSGHYDIPAGLYVSDVQENSDAQAKGVQVGDILTAVNGTPVSTTEEVSAIKDSLKVGDSMVLSLWREGEMLEVEIELMDTNDLY